MQTAPLTHSGEASVDHPFFRSAVRTAAFVGAGLFLGIAVVFGSVPLALGVLAGVAVTVIVFRSPFAGLLIYIAIEFIRPGEIFPALDAFHIQGVFGLLLLTALALVWVSHALQRRHGETVAEEAGSLGVEGQSLALLALLGTMFASVATAHSKMSSLISAVEFARIVVFYFVIIYLVRTERQARLVIWLYVLIVGWHAAWAVYGYLTGTSVSFAQNIWRATGSNVLFGNFNALAALVASTVPFAACLVAVERKWGLRILAGAVAVIGAWAVIFTASRAGAVALGAVLLYLVLNSRRRMLALGLAAAVAAGLWLAMPQENRERILSIEHYEQDASALGRLDSWAAARRMFADRPLLGVGIGGFRRAHGDLYSSPYYPSYLDSHSVFFQALAEIGLLGLVAFASFIALVVRNQVRARQVLRRVGAVRSHAYYMLVALGGGLLSMLVSGISANNLFKSSYYLIAALTLVYLRLAWNRQTAWSSEVVAGTGGAPAVNNAAELPRGGR
jgi:O-antigen ligase